MLMIFNIQRCIAMLKSLKMVGGFFFSILHFALYYNVKGYCVTAKTIIYQLKKHGRNGKQCVMKSNWVVPGFIKMKNRTWSICLLPVGFNLSSDSPLIDLKHYLFMSSLLINKSEKKKKDSEPSGS